MRPVRPGGLIDDVLQFVCEQCRDVSCEKCGNRLNLVKKRKGGGMISREGLKEKEEALSS